MTDIRMGAERPAAGPVVAGFGPGGFRVENQTYAALLLLPDRAEGWTPPPFEELTADALEPLAAIAPEFVLLGTGPTLRRPPPALTRALEARNVGLEAMDSRAAARAWGVLRMEGRRIAAALYPLA